MPDATMDDREGRSIPINAGGPFELVDHHGSIVTNESFFGRHTLVFFGYANCRNMCSITLTRIGNALKLVENAGDHLNPLVITVDPLRDTPDNMGEALAHYHESLIGLSGSPEQLQAAYKAFNQKPEVVGEDWNGEPIISHSSYIYLLDERGELATFFPPILNAESMAKILRKYLNS